MADPPATNPAFEQARALDASLEAQLDHYAASLAVRLPDTAHAYQALVDRLAGAGCGSGAPAEGDVLPPFVLPDETGRLVASAELLARGPLVVSFNRGSWCPFCWLELAALAERHAAVSRMGGEIVSITPETAAYAKKLKRRLGLPFPVLSDMDNGYALELGLAIPLSSEIRTRFSAAGISLDVYQNNDAWFVPIPATFVVDRAGVVRRSYVNADFRRRVDPGDVVASVSGSA